jgi:hypothetical protein
MAPGRTTESPDQIVRSCAAATDGVAHCLYLAQQLNHLVTRDLSVDSFRALMDQIRAGASGGLPPDVARAARAVLLDVPVERRYEEAARARREMEQHPGGGTSVADQTAFVNRVLGASGAAYQIGLEGRRRLVELADRLEAVGRTPSPAAAREAEETLNRWRAGRSAHEPNAAEDDTREFSLTLEPVDRVGTCLDYPAAKLSALVVYVSAGVLEYGIEAGRPSTPSAGDAADRRRDVLMRRDGPEWVAEETIDLPAGGRRIVRWRLAWEDSPIRRTIWSTDYTGLTGAPQGATCRVTTRFTGNVKAKK